MSLFLPLLLSLFLDIQSPDALEALKHKSDLFEWLEDARQSVVHSDVGLISIFLLKCIISAFDKRNERERREEKRREEKRREEIRMRRKR